MWSPTHVQVTVQRARNLQNKGRKGTNDAFVLIQLGKEKFQTTVKEKANDPEWYEECDLTLIGRDSDVVLTVFHRNILGLEEFLGQAFVSLQGIESFDRTFTKWYPLKGKTEKSEEKNRGELEVKIAFIVRRCNDTQSLNDLSFKKKKNSLKHLAVSMGHKIQKLPSRSLSLRNLDPRKKLEQLKEKRLSTASDHSLPEEDGTGDFEDSEEFNTLPMKRHGSLYSSTLSLPQSTMITSSIREAESLEELSQVDKDMPQEDMSDSSNSVENQTINIPKPLVRKNSLNTQEKKILNRGEWTNRILAHSKESPIARSETNLIEALRSESPIVPTRRNKFDTLRHNLRRQTLQLADAPDLAGKKGRMEAYRQESPPNFQSPIPEGIPSEVIQQFEKMNQKDLILLAIKQQADLERQRDKIVDLENYLDNLLVRVMETTPKILQKPYNSHTCQRRMHHRFYSRRTFTEID